MEMVIVDFEPGPLDNYRKCASFDWKKIKIFLESEETININDEIINKLRQNVNLYPTFTVQTLDEKRHTSSKGMMILNNLANQTPGHRKLSSSYIYWDPSTTGKYIVSSEICTRTLTSLGTERHYKYVKDTWNGKTIGCICLTEIGHGTNLKGMRTTAKYDLETQQFILNTPDFEAAKCWAANLGKVATYGIVYAQLYTPDGNCHGLHYFVVDIRDKQTFKPYSGIIVGDMGAKAGLNGIDNGFIMFKNYRIPRESLLNKTADVTTDGQYVTLLKDPSGMFGISLGVLSSSRVYIIHVGNTYFEKALTIAIRYAAVRKQFGPSKKEELPNLEYQLHQLCLLPYLAVCYVFKNIAVYLCTINKPFQIDSELDINKDRLTELGHEIHAISSAGKSVSSWIIRDGIQECVEACGQHGYLEVSEIFDLRNNHDANCTYEGDNNVLCQQTSNWLLKFWPLILNGKKIPPMPINSIYYLNDAKKILQKKFIATTVEEAYNPKNILNVYKWLVCYLLKESYDKIQIMTGNGIDAFTAKNNTQVFYLRNLSVVYFEHFCIEKFCDKIDTATDYSIKTVLQRLLSLYGVWSLDKHITILYQGGYANGSEPAYLIKQGILNLCDSIKLDAVSLVDAVAPNDFLMQSPLGKSDGQVYKHLEAAFLNASDASKRPDWWQDIVNWKQFVSNKL